MSNLRKLVLLSLFSAIAAIGGIIKIPAPIGSIALDSAPALLVASLFTGGYGAIVAFVGHLASALYSGFPLGPFHLMVAVEIAVLTWIFGMIFHRDKRVTAAILFFIGNSFVAGMPFIALFSFEFYIGIVIPLAIATGINLTIAHFTFPPLKKLLNRSSEL